MIHMQGEVNRMREGRVRETRLVRVSQDKDKIRHNNV